MLNEELYTEFRSYFFLHLFIELFHKIRFFSWQNKLQLL